MTSGIETKILVASALNVDNFVKSENDLQKGCAKLLDGLGVLWTHVPNEGKRSGRAGATLQHKGMKRGIPDILIFEAMDRYIGIAIELKYGSNKLTQEQEVWLQRLSDRHWLTGVCKSMNEVIDMLVDGGVLLKSDLEGWR